MRASTAPRPPLLRYRTLGGKIKCVGCVEKWATHYHNHMDGRGRIRLHTRDFFPEGETDFDTEYLACREQGWTSRHPVYAALIILAIAVLIGALAHGV